MNDTIITLPNGDFEVIKEERLPEEISEWLKENPPFGGPYQFARDRVVEKEIEDDKQRRESEKSSRSKGEDQQRSGKRDNYVSSREW